MSDLLHSYTGRGTRAGATATKGLDTFTAYHAWLLLRWEGWGGSYSDVREACDKLKIRRTGVTPRFRGHFQVRREDMPRLRVALFIPS